MPKFAVIDSNGNILRMVSCSKRDSDLQIGYDGFAVEPVNGKVNDSTHKFDNPGLSTVKCRPYTAVEKVARKNAGHERERPGRP